MPVPIDPLQRTIAHLYRDCLRIASRVAAPENLKNVSKTIGMSFRKNMHEKDPEKIEGHKKEVINAISNYVFFQSSKGTKIEEQRNIRLDKLRESYKAEAEERKRLAALKGEQNKKENNEQEQE